LFIAPTEALGEKPLFRTLPQTKEKISDEQWHNILKSLAPKADNPDAKPIVQSKIEFKIA